MQIPPQNGRLVGSGVVFMHAKLWEAAHHALNHARHCSAVNALYDGLHAIISGAFSFEAYMNFLGPKRMPNWSQLERKPVVEKYKAIARTLKLQLDFTKPPYSHIRQLFDIRNQLAHAQVTGFPIDRPIEIDAIHAMAEADDTPFETLCAPVKVEELLTAIEHCVMELHERSGEPLHPFLVHGVSVARSNAMTSLTDKNR